GVLLGVGLPGQLPGLADRHESGPELIRDRRADHVSARFDADDVIDARVAVRADERVDERLETLRIAEQRRNVAEEDSRDREVRDGSNERLDRCGHGTRRSRSPERGLRRRRRRPVIDLRNQRTRLIVAFALAIALHEIALGFIHFPRSEPTSEQPVKAPLVVIRIPPPTPAPKPTPRPTPRPTPVPPTPPPEVTVPPHVTPAPVRQLAGRASGHPARHRGGGAHAAVAKAVTGTYANPNAAGAG